MKGIKLERIPQAKIRSFIRQQIANGVTTFRELTSTYRPGDPLSCYHFHEKEYQLDLPREQLWKYYLKANPSVAWEGDLLSFGLMVSKKDQKVMYPGEPYQGITEGQVLFVSVKVIGGLLELPLAHEIVDVNHERFYLEVSYIKGGKSAGKQRITFYKNKDGSTKINHSTYYRSASALRDKLVYPYFHTQAIDSYHSNMVCSFLDTVHRKT